MILSIILILVFLLLMGLLPAFALVFAAGLVLACIRLAFKLVGFGLKVTVGAVGLVCLLGLFVLIL